MLFNDYLEQFFTKKKKRIPLYSHNHTQLLMPTDKIHREMGLGGEIF